MLRVTLAGHLTLESLRLQLEPASKQLQASSARPVLFIDCSTMTSYDNDARAAFINWNTNYRDKIRGVAIFTEKTIWHMVIKTMALASRQTMLPFMTKAEAEAWAMKQEALPDKGA